MQAYRCQNPECSEDRHGRLIFNFLATEPVCPKCKADSRKSERAETVIRLETIHYLTRDNAGAVVGLLGNRYRMACQPGKLDGHRATGSPADVTCRRCREMPEWLAAYTGEPTVAAT